MGLGSGSAAIAFESLAVASRALQRRPRRNDFLFHHEAHEAQRNLELGKQESRKWISEIEGKGARVAASEAGHTVSCVPAFLINLPANGIRFKTDSGQFH
jgi:hypothetical protein